MKTTTVTRQRASEFVNEQMNNSANASSQYDESSRYSWYYEENGNDESCQDRTISISRFASVELERNPINLKIVRNESNDQSVM
jgi:hypothetical protein